MNRFQAFVRGLGDVLGAFYVLSAAALSFELVFRHPTMLDLRWAETPLGMVLLYLSGSLATLLGLFFVLRLWGHVHKRRWFCREGIQGPIQVSPVAIQDFIQALLAQEDFLGRSRVRLAHGPQDTLDVDLNVHLPLNVSVVETAERLQQLLKYGVEEQMGISVNRVSVYAQRIDVPGDRGGQAIPDPATQGERTEETSPRLEEYHDKT